MISGNYNEIKGYLSNLTASLNAFGDMYAYK
jgi:hypothetical protein